MKSLGLGRYALTIGAAAALLAGCGGSPSGGTAASPVGNSIDQRPAKGGAQFLYVAGDGHSYVLSYPRGTLIGTIDGGAASTCADHNGNAFLTLDTSVTEYHNGGTTPTKTLEVGGDTKGCASDPTTGNLAVTFYSTSGNVAIFPDASGSPTFYHDDIDAYYCGYDNEGNLFIDGLTVGRSEQFVLTELPKGGSTFETIAITPNITNRPAQVQWDGQYITVAATLGDVKKTTVYRLQISGSTATVVGSTSLQGNGRAVGISWITGSQLLLPFATRSGKGTPNVVGVWKYARGGKRTKILNVFPKFAGLNGASVVKAK